MKYNLSNIFKKKSLSLLFGICLLYDIFYLFETKNKFIILLIPFGIMTAFRLGAKKMFIMSLALLSSSVTMFIFNLNVQAEKSAYWAYLLLTFAVLVDIFFNQAIHLKKKFENKVHLAQKLLIIAVNLIKNDLKKRTFFPQLKIVYDKRYIVFMFLFGITILGLFYYIPRYQKNIKIKEWIARNPRVSKIEPLIAYKGMKIIIKGENFDENPQQMGTHLMSSIGQINTDLWTGKKIIFTIPLHWQTGTIDIWIEKIITWEGKKITVTTDPIQLRLLPITQNITMDDMLYFEQLQQLDRETLEINGYRNSIK